MSRRVGKKPKRKKILPLPGSYLIATEGVQTEVLYFKSLAAELAEKYARLAGRIAVTIPSLTIKGTGVSNLTLIDRVAEVIQLSPTLFEHVWVVFDKDDIPLDKFDNAIKLAEQLGWHAAWSNDSFELWYLLHFEFLNTAIDREAYKDKLTRHMRSQGIQGKYEKNTTTILPLLTAEKRQRAIRFAKKLADYYQPTVPYHLRNPGTTVYQLVAELTDLEQRAEVARRKLTGESATQN